MQSIQEAASAFSASKRAAVTGVSRTMAGAPLLDPDVEVFVQGVRNTLDNFSPAGSLPSSPMPEIRQTSAKEYS